MRTKAELKKAIKKLQTERKTLPSHSMFGIDNWGSIDTYISILSQVVNGKMIWPEDRLEEILEDYVGVFPPEDTSDYWKVTALDYILENREDI